MGSLLFPLRGGRLHVLKIECEDRLKFPLLRSAVPVKVRALNFYSLTYLLVSFRMVVLDPHDFLPYHYFLLHRICPDNEAVGRCRRNFVTAASRRHDGRGHGLVAASRL